MNLVLLLPLILRSLFTGILVKIINFFNFVNLIILSYLAKLVVFVQDRFLKGELYADEINAIFMGTSAMEGLYVEKLFIEIGKYYYRIIQRILVVTIVIRITRR